MIIIIFITILAVILGMAAYIIYELRKENSELSENVSLLITEKNTLLFQKKQSEIVTGQVAEKLAPFLKGFNHDPKNIQFLGNPVDFIVFEEKGITIIEVKSANSRLTSKQRNIKKQIKEKKIFWEEFRIK